MTQTPAAQVECVMNVSEGRDPETIEALCRAVQSVTGAHLLDTHSDPDHNRSVLTFLGDLRTCPEAAYAAIGEGVRRIDLRRHRGVHPRVGAIDVVPFVPIQGVTVDETVSRVQRLAQRVGADYSIPVFLYEAAALHPERADLARIRQGGLEGLKARMERDPNWVPDYGPPHLHPTAGACVIGVRKPLIAFNIFLDSPDVTLARRIAREIRERDGGLKGVKALGLYLQHRGRAQVSINLTDFHSTSLKQVFDQVSQAAEKAGTRVYSSELIGLAPAEALNADLARYLKLQDFAPDRILEARIEKVLREAAGS